MSLEEKRIVIAGGSGFLGLSLAHYLVTRGASVAVLSRKRPSIDGPWTHRSWNGRTADAWMDELNGAAALINLAGRSVDCIKTPDHQDEILRSRVESTRVLGEAVRSVAEPPSVWIQMSTAHIYGDPPREVCAEGAALGCGLAPFVGKAWEEAFRLSVLPSQRGVVFRTGFVIGRNLGAGGGALQTLGWLARVGLGGRVGSGTQGMSWIHETDLNRLFERAVSDSSMQGVYNVSSPNPVAQAEFMRALRRAVGMPIGLPAPAWLVRLGAHYLLRTDPDLALYGRYATSSRLRDEGFEFDFPQIEPALQNLLNT